VKLTATNLGKGQRNGKRPLRPFATPDYTAVKRQVPSSLLGRNSIIPTSVTIALPVIKHKPWKTATLDMDATLAEAMKKTALYCYKGFKSYQPFNVWWHEHGIILHTEFRDGNVACRV